MDESHTSIPMLNPFSSKPSSSKKMVKNAEVQEYPTNLEALNKWVIPTVKPSTVYKIGTFDFNGIKSLNMVEQTISLTSEEQTIQLLDALDLDKYHEKYNFIHIGLIQVAFKPVTLNGLPASFLAVLRDARNLD